MVCGCPGDGLCDRPTAHSPCKVCTVVGSCDLLYRVKMFHVSLFVSWKYRMKNKAAKEDYI